MSRLDPRSNRDAGVGREVDAGSTESLREGMECPEHSEAHLEAIRENGQRAGERVEREVRESVIVLCK